LNESNSSTMNKFLHADMQLSSQSSVFWSAHIFSAMDGLTQSYIYKQKQQNCETIDLSRFVVDLRERHLEHWTPSYSDTHPREHKPLHVTTGVLFLQKGLWSLGHLTNPFQIHVSNLPRNVIRSTARFRLRVQP